MTTRSDNTRKLLLTTVILVLLMLACVFQAPTTPADNTPAVKPVLSVKPTTPTTTPETSVVTAYQSLHVRTARMGIRIGYLYHGDIVTLTGTCDQGWAEIRWKGGSAWVNSDYLSKNKCSEEQ